MYLSEDRTRQQQRATVAWCHRALALLGCLLAGAAMAAPAVVNVSMPADRVYNHNFVRREHWLGVTVNFNEPVTVAGSVALVIKVGSSSREATTILTTGTKSITFDVAPRAYEEGSLTVTGPLVLHGGSIKGADGSDAVLTFAEVSAPGVIFDVNPPPAPRVIDITPASPNSEEKFTIRGTSELNTSIAYLLDNNVAGDTTVDAEGKWSVTLGPVNAGAHSLGVTARDSAGNYTDLLGSMVTGINFTVQQAATPLAPTISRIGNLGAGSYWAGTSFLIGVFFSAPVQFEGNPLLNVTIGGQPRQMTYYSYSASNGNVAYFYYKIGAADSGTLAISGPLELNGGRISREGIDANREFAPVATSMAIGQGAPPAAPVVTNFSPASPKVGESLTVTGTAEPLAVVMYALDGGIQSSATVGMNGAWTATAGPVTSAGGHTFNAYVQSSTRGVSTTTTVNFSAQAAPATPTVTQIVPPIGSYEAGRSLLVGVKFSAPVTVSGTPLLNVRVGGTARQFVYYTYTDNTAYFRYEVAADDNGALVVNGPVALNGGTIKDQSGTLDAKLDFAEVQTSVTFTGTTSNPPPSEPPPAEPPHSEPPPSEPPPSAPPPAEPPPPAPAPVASRLINVSSRLQVADAGNAERTLIMGFAIRGAGQQRMLLRGVGPSLAEFGVQAPLPNPRLGLFSADGRVIRENEDWSTDVAGTIAQMGAFSLYAGSRDAALVQDLPAGSFSIHVLGNGGTGVALAEIFGSNNPNAGGAVLTNLSARGFVGRGEAQLGAGFVISGTEPMRVLLRGVGMTLSAFGVREPLSDPVLTLYQGTAVLAQNDNWEAAATAGTLQTAAPAEITAAGSATGAFSLPAGGTDAALLVTLEPGEYTLFVSGAGGATGIGLVEVYEVR